MTAKFASSLRLTALTVLLSGAAFLAPTLGASAPAQAAEKWAPRVQVGAQLGYLGLDNPNGLGNAFYVADVPSGGLLVGLRATYPLLQTVMIDGELNFTPSSLPASKAGPAGKSATLLSYRLLGRYTFMPGSKLRPFVTAGIGQINMSTDKQYVKPNDTDNTFILGAGARLQLGYRLFARADARWVTSDARPDEKERDAQGQVIPGGKTITHGRSQNFEMTVGLAYAFGGPARDQDSDGVPDKADKCPLKAEDRDGFQDKDGCPDLDNDGDGVVDGGDRCPNTAEDRDGYQDDDGCPELDNDGDGIADTADKCPNKPEDRDGFQDKDGCPDADNDRDGIADKQDRCPNKAEDRDGYQDSDGCPEPDNDGDGIPDTADKCPNKAEDKNGFQDKDGCPENMPAHIAPLFNGPVKGIAFRGAKLKRGSSKVLEMLLELLLEREDIKIEIHVHTHTRGKAAKLHKLAARRGQAIVKFYEDAGIDANRFRVVAHGGDEPLDKGKGRKAKAVNERVLFKIARPPSRPGK